MDISRTGSASGLFADASLARSGAAEPLAPIASAPDIDDALRRGAAACISTSGGKDSQSCALATVRYLDEIGHAGPRILIHADLGLVEWKESLPECERLARHLGLELVVVRRKGGGMMERWESRWDSSVRRYRELETVTLVPCWSGPSLRFCTSEQKTYPITSELRRRYRNIPIVNITGVRREESAGRARGSVWSLDERLSRQGAPFFHWRPISDWRLRDVIECVDASGLTLHPAYTRWGMQRVSCVFCVLGSGSDLRSSAANPDNSEAYLRMVELEARSSFAFQGSRWLADVAPSLLPSTLQERVERAKQVAELRKRAEKSIPDDLMFNAGRPRRIPSVEEAALLARVRRDVAAAVGIEDMRYVTAREVIERYASLLGVEGGASTVSGARASGARELNEVQLELI
jgi:3'-phosphoadenosine 5'-phosphosulfate sulfotransferase (PAPS reductase)/FAD synthetase